LDFHNLNFRLNRDQGFKLSDKLFEMKLVQYLNRYSIEG
jgi:hypothetical protein